MNFQFRLLILILSFFILHASSAFSQLISSDPTFPSDQDEVVITFNAALGSAGLAGYTGDVYAHTGVITENSTASNDWKYVQADWGENIPKCKMTRIGTDLYQLNISPAVRQYYDVPAGEKILQMAFVFRSAQTVNDQWLEGKTETFGDIFIDIAEAGLQTTFVYPDENANIVETGDTIFIKAESQYADSIFLFINNNLKKKAEGNIITDSIVAETFGKYRVKVIAKNDTSSVADSIYYFVRTDPQVVELPEGITEGINVIDETSVILCLYAPYKDYVFALGDFSDWEVEEATYMYRTPDAKHYWIQLNGLSPSREYVFQYWVDGEILIGDPYAEKVSDPWNDKYITYAVYPDLIPYPEGKTTGIATVFQTQPDEYIWTAPDFTPPAVTDLVVYELLVRDFVYSHCYQSLIDTLPYLKELGINAIELMPVNEFEGNISWGYNPSYYFAPDKYYGTKDKLKEFIDECHNNGIAVILDVVFNHSFGQSPMVMLYWDSENGRPAANNPWYNPVAKHDYNVGYDFNHESVDTKRFVDRAVTFWLNEYHVDGFRFDLSKGFTQENTLGYPDQWAQQDDARIAILKRIADTIWSTKSNAYVILEHFADNSEEKILAEYGMLLWGNENYHYTEASMGWYNTSNLSWASYKARGWTKPHAVVYMESHDEERMMYKNVTYGRAEGDYDIQDTITALERAQLATLFFLSVPGPKMIWQFGEMGYYDSINYNGRTGPKPIRWYLLDDFRREYLHDFYATLITLKQEQEFFRTTDFSQAVTGAMKRINLNGNPVSATILGNFNVTTGTVGPNFQHIGVWYEYFTRDSILVTDVNALISLEPGEYRFYTDQKLAAPDLNTGVVHIGHDTTYGFSVFPNPANEKISVVYRLDQEALVEIGLMSLGGAEFPVAHPARQTPGTYTVSIPTDRMKSGICLVKFTINGKVFLQKVIIR
ncbi:MAG TPA: alpha-amylase family glycosyl hydrolase [Bacteroidales bacterium]|nr:alpha-amylase family glycosyl hydrolase [Bacteroidales bacterium]HNS47281.1 alpha-amylase family glycosyl hydrolase [Bacteroidales bacterium]